MAEGHVLNINLELTTYCPLRCPQCYCSLNAGHYMDLETAKKWIIEANKSGITDIMLSGGETIAYPYLDEVISFSKENGLVTHAAFSGWNLTKERCQRLICDGLDNIYISLNGSTEQVNRESRDGYQLAIDSLSQLREIEFSNTYINWVFHSSNSDDFENMVSLAETYKVRALVIIGFKPDSRAQMPSVPNFEQMKKVVNYMKRYKGNVELLIEKCYSPLRALRCDTWLGNFNTGKYRGCEAGLGSISVNVDGTLSPCRHINAHEKYASFADYYRHSPLIQQLRALDETKAEEKCSSCKYMMNCKPCMAINTEMFHRIFWGYPTCPVP